MLGRRSFKVAFAIVALAAGALGPTTAAQATGYSDPTVNLPRKMGKVPGIGPHSPYVQEILINTVVPLKNGAIVNRTKYGYLYRAGQQNSDLKMTMNGGRIQFVDSGTEKWKWLPRACKKFTVPQGVGASCSIPTRYTGSHPMLVEVWPRWGDDVVDARALSSLFDVSVLGDRGNDTFYGGAGGDFFNGAQDNDKAYGGDGRDWLRTGLGTDVIDGGAGGDHLVGVEGNDVLYSGSGEDLVYCGNGSDTAWAKTTDRTSSCENLNRS
jgi:serralysin